MRTSTKQALAFWLREPGVGAITPVPVCEPAADEVLVRTRWLRATDVTR